MTSFILMLLLVVGLIAANLLLLRHGSKAKNARPGRPAVKAKTEKATAAVSSAPLLSSTDATAQHGPNSDQATNNDGHSSGNNSSNNSNNNGAD